MNKQSGYSFIRVTDETKQLLNELGQKQETYDDIIKKLIAKKGGKQ